MCTHMCVYIYIVYMCVCVYISLSLFIYIVYIYIYIYICMYTYYKTYNLPGGKFCLIRQLEGSQASVKFPQILPQIGRIYLIGIFLHIW